MKTVTDAFVSVQKKPSNIGVRQVFYKKRHWSQTTNAYVWDANWTQLPESEIVKVSPIIWNLDTDQLNEFKVSNVTIIADDSLNQWRPDNSAGYFAADDDSPVHGYEPYWMKFQVRGGYELEDGTTEVVTMFTGLATEYVMNSTQKTCQITVHGLEAILVNAKAEGIATTVTEENAGTGDGSDTEFETLNPGVGRITEVSVDGIRQLEGEDYSVSQLEDETLPAKVTFETPPLNLAVVRISYFYWPQDQEFSDLVVSLLESAGITSHDVQPVIFSNSVLNALNFTSQADWDAGTKTRIDTTSAPGSIRVDWSSSTFAELTTWGESLTDWVATSGGDAGAGNDAWSTDGTKLTHVSNSIAVGSGIYDGRITRDQDRLCGTFQFDFQFETTGVDQIITFGTIAERLSIHDTGNFEGFDVVSSWTPDTNWHTVKMIRYGSGRMLVYLDGVLKIDGTWPETSASSLRIVHRTIGNTARTVNFRAISRPTATAAASWESATMDFGSAPTAWGFMSVDVSTPTGTLRYYTRTSTDDVSYDAHVEANGSLLPQSAFKRFGKLKIDFLVDTTLDGEVQVDLAAFAYITSSVPVTLPALAGSSVYEAIQTIGTIAGYEFGFTPNEEFFFRSRQPGSSVITLTGNDYNSKISGMDSGYSRVYGTVRVTYGEIVREVTDDGLSPLSPKARVGDRRFELNLDNTIQIPPSADIATGVAATIFKELSKPRRRLKLTTKFLPQLDLSDVVTVTLNNNHHAHLWYLGDPHVVLGQSDVHLWGDGEQIVAGLEAKVIGARFDTSNWSSEFDLEEVL